MHRRRADDDLARHAGDAMSSDESAAAQRPESTVASATAGTPGEPLTAALSTTRRYGLATTVAGWTMMLTAIMVGVGLMVMTEESADITSGTSHPYVGLGIAVGVAGVITGLLIAAVGQFLTTWAMARGATTATPVV